MLLHSLHDNNMVVQTGGRTSWKTNEFSITCPFSSVTGSVAVVLVSRIESRAKEGKPHGLIYIMILENLLQIGLQ